MISHSPISDVPVKGPTIFTGANKNTAGYWTPENSKVLPHSFSSVQPAELWAIYLVLQDFPQIPINIVSDSPYAVLSCLQLPHVSLPLTLKTAIDKLFLPSTTIALAAFRVNFLYSHLCTFCPSWTLIIWKCYN